MIVAAPVADRGGCRPAVDRGTTRCELEVLLHLSFCAFALEVFKVFNAFASLIPLQSFQISPTCFIHPVSRKECQDSSVISASVISEWGGNKVLPLSVNRMAAGASRTAQ